MKTKKLALMLALVVTCVTVFALMMGGTAIAFPSYGECGTSGCHLGTFGTPVTAVPSTPTSAPGAAYTVNITIPEGPSVGLGTGYAIYACSSTGVITGVQLASAGAASTTTQSKTANMTAPTTAGTYYYKAYGVDGTASAGRTGAAIYSITVTTTTPPVVEPPVVEPPVVEPPVVEPPTMPHGYIAPKLTSDYSWKKVCNSCHGRSHDRSGCARCHGPGDSEDVHSVSRHSNCSTCHTISTTDKALNCSGCHDMHDGGHDGSSYGGGDSHDGSSYGGSSYGGSSYGGSSYGGSSYGGSSYGGSSYGGSSYGGSSYGGGDSHDGSSYGGGSRGGRR